MLYVVVIQFLSSVVPLTEMAGFTPFLVQLLALCPSTCLVLGHPPSSNQSSLSPHISSYNLLVMILCDCVLCLHLVQFIYVNIYCCTYSCCLRAQHTGIAGAI